MTLAEQIQQTEEQRVRDITARIASLVPNLEEDSEFREKNSTFGDGANVVAVRRALKAETEKEFSKIEILYHEFHGGFFRRMVYAIGRGKIYSGGKWKDALFYLGRWDQNPEYRPDQVHPITLERIRELRLLE